MLEFAAIFFLRLIDQALNTYKTVLLTKGRRTASAVTNAIAAGTFLLIIQRMQMHEDSFWSILAVCLATFAGSYLAQFVADKQEKDRIFIFEITPKSSESGKRIADMLRAHDLPVMTYKGYNSHLEPVLCVRVYTRSKAESHLVESLLPDESECKWSVFETRTVAPQQ